MKGGIKYHNAISRDMPSNFKSMNTRYNSPTVNKIRIKPSINLAQAVSPNAPEQFHRPHTALLTNTLVKKVVRHSSRSPGPNLYNYQRKSTTPVAHKIPNVTGENFTKVYNDRLSSASGFRRM